MRPSGIRFLVAAGALFAGVALVWLSAAVPTVAGAQAGSALDTGPEGWSQFASRIRDRGMLAQTVAIDSTPDGYGLSPLPWDAWRMRPQDAILSVRSDIALTSAELAAARPWLEAGGRLVVVAESPQELVIAQQLVGARIPSVPLFDGAFDGTPSRALVPDGGHVYQLDGAQVVIGPGNYLGSAGLAWAVTPEPSSANALQAYAFAVLFPIGAGSILVLGDSHPLSNGGLPQADNERLAQRILDHISGGVVFIDEGHRTGGGLRLDIALRAIGPEGRIVVTALLVLVAVTLVYPWPSRVMDAVLRRLLRPEDPPAPDPLAAIAARHPDWDQRLLGRLWSGDPDEGRQA
jgi:hypothetical protein